MIIVPTGFGGHVALSWTTDETSEGIHRAEPIPIGDMGAATGLVRRFVRAGMTRALRGAVDRARPGRHTCDLQDAGIVEEVARDLVARRAQAWFWRESSFALPTVAAAAERPRALVDPTLTWIEIRLIDTDGLPVAGERYHLVLPDGSEQEGYLDGAGRAHVTGIKPGNCKVSFPDIDASEWKSAG